METREQQRVRDQVEKNKDNFVKSDLSDHTVSQELHQPKTFGTRDLTSRILLTSTIT